MTSNRYDVQFLSNDSFFKKKKDIVSKRLYGTAPTTQVNVPTDTPSFLGLGYDYYDVNNYNVLYHEDASYQLWDTTASYTTYRPYGAFKYGAKSYVPTYEDSVYLSRQYGVRKDMKSNSEKSIGYFPIEKKHDMIEFGSFSMDSTKPTSNIITMTPTARPLGPNVKEDSFCDDIHLSNDERDSICHNMTESSCMNSSCCVTVGKQCVYGNETGPFSNNIYDSDESNFDKDYYYYKNKCYGKCPDRILEHIWDNKYL